MVSKDEHGTFHRVLPDRRRHCWGFRHLRGAHDRTEPEGTLYTLVLFLPDQRLDHELWVVLGCGSKREDLMGQDLERDTEIRDRVGCHHRGAAYFRLCPGPIAGERVPSWWQPERSHQRRISIQVVVVDCPTF